MIFPGQKYIPASMEAGIYFSCPDEVYTLPRLFVDYLTNPRDFFVNFVLELACRSKDVSIFSVKVCLLRLAHLGDHVKEFPGVHCFCCLIACKARSYAALFRLNAWAASSSPASAFRFKFSQ